MKVIRSPCILLDAVILREKRLAAPVTGKAAGIPAGCKAYLKEIKNPLKELLPTVPIF